ncbi:MAG: hypothetical protein AAFO75_04320 [Pseudomonadota bacterium]
MLLFKNVLPLSIAGLCMLVAASSSVCAKDPDFRPGTDPGGLAITLIGSGIDYTNRDISKRLARDGEGTPIGWDFVDGNHKPFAEPDGESTNAGMETVKALLSSYKSSRLIVVRADVNNASSMAQALAMASKMPGAIIAVPKLPDADGWKLITAVAEHAPKKLFVVPASPEWGDKAIPENIVRAAPFDQWASLHGPAVDVWMTKPGAGLFGDLIVRGGAAANGQGPDPVQLAVARAAANAACAQHSLEVPLVTGKAAKDAFLKLARPSKLRPGVMVHDPLCLYGGQLLKGR